ncbi:MAG: EamA family transporter [Pseudomonadota bacterium]|nr:EamA family transporter [Pseudomonadota bacterium]
MGEIDIAAIALALLSALMFAITFLLIRVGVGAASSFTALWLTLSVNVALLWSWSLLTKGWQFGDWREWRYFMMAGLFAPLLGRLFQFQGMARLGASITTPLTLTHPVVSIVLAMLFLDASATLPGLLGASLVLLGSLLVSAQSGGNQEVGTGEVSRLHLLFPLAASFSYGVSVVFRKVGIDAGTDAVTASAVTTTASWLFASLYLFGGVRSAIHCSRREFGFLMLAGIFSSLGPVFLYLALQHGSLTIVAPLAATTPLFVLLASCAFLRDTEIVNRWVVFGTLTTVLGVNIVILFGLA